MSLTIHGLAEGLAFAEGTAPAVVTLPGHGTFEARYWPKIQPLPEGWQRVVADGNERATPTGMFLIRKESQSLATVE